MDTSIREQQRESYDPPSLDMLKRLATSTRGGWQIPQRSPTQASSAMSVQCPDRSSEQVAIQLKSDYSIQPDAQCLTARIKGRRPVLKRPHLSSTFRSQWSKTSSTAGNQSRFTTLTGTVMTFAPLATSPEYRTSMVCAPRLHPTSSTVATPLITGALPRNEPPS